MNIASLLPVLSLLFLASSDVTTPKFRPNGYWPGDFERGFIGGMYSNNHGCRLSDQVNRTDGGTRSWKITPGYQHLELLLPAERKAKVSFWAKSDTPQTLDVNVITPAEVTKKNPAGTRKIIHTIDIKPGEAWQQYELSFDMVEPFPYLRASEILLSSYNAGDASWYIDDLEIRWEQDTEAGWKNVGVITNGDLEAGDTAWADATLAKTDDGGSALAVGTADSPVPVSRASHQSFDATAIAGKRVRMAADIAYESHENVDDNWSAVVIAIKADGKVIPAIDRWPLWMPLGMAGPVGQFKTIAAEFDIPEEVQSLRLEVVAQPGLTTNVALVDNIRIQMASED
jgi:hypothetical protein